MTRLNRFFATLTRASSSFAASGGTLDNQGRRASWYSLLSPSFWLVAPYFEAQDVRDQQRAGPSSARRI